MSRTGLTGYRLAEALKDEAVNNIADEKRAALVMDAAEYIEELIKSSRAKIETEMKGGTP